MAPPSSDEDQIFDKPETAERSDVLTKAELDGHLRPNNSQQADLPITEANIDIDVDLTFEGSQPNDLDYELVSIHYIHPEWANGILLSEGPGIRYLYPQ